MRRYARAYVRWFDRMASGNAGLALLAVGIALWALMLTDSLPR